MLIAKEETYRKLSTFDSVEEMNDIIRKHRSAHDLSTTELAVLDVLARHSCKIAGVSFLTKNTIARLVDKSRRTIIRVCNRLESLGIIVQHHVKRASDMQQTSNAIVIQSEVKDVIKDEGSTKAKTQETAIVAQDVSHQEALRPRKQKATKVIDTAIIVSDALRNSLPSKVFEAFSTYFHAEDIYKYYGILLRAKRKIDRTLLIEDCSTPFTDAIHAVVLKAKRGKVRSLTSYFYRAFEAAASQARRLLTEPDNGVYYDWLID